MLYGITQQGVFVIGLEFCGYNPNVIAKKTSLVRIRSHFTENRYKRFTYSIETG